MREMNPTQHPSSHPDFNPQSDEKVWYLSHPLAADDKYDFMTNVAHAKQMMRMCYDAGYRVIAPYLSIIEVLDDNNFEHRRIGLECDCYVAHALGRIIMTGHKRSSGMLHEHDAVVRRVDEWNNKYIDRPYLQINSADVIIDLVGMNNETAFEHLEYRRSRLNSGSKLVNK